MMNNHACNPAHIALIGGGFTGTTALMQLVDDCPVDEITLFEASGLFGPGYAYQPDECPDYLINNTTATMRLLPDQPNGFLTWLQMAGPGGPDKISPFEPDGHLPRATFGTFLRDAVQAACTLAAAKGIWVRLIPHEVISLTEDETGQSIIRWIDHTGQTGTIRADATILTTGRCPGRNTIPAPPTGGATLVTNHIMDTQLDDVPDDAIVHVLGASLSAYDVVNRLFSPDSGCHFARDEQGALVFHAGPNQRHVMLCSRSGRIKGVQAPVDPVIKRQHFTLQAMRKLAAGPGLTLTDVAAMIRQEAAAHGVKVDWNALASPYENCTSPPDVTARAAALLASAIHDATSPGRMAFMTGLFTDAANDIWQAFAEDLLPPAEEARYRRDFETAALCFAAPCPVPTAERLLALMHAGRLHIRAGTGPVALTDDGNYAIPHAHGLDTAKVLVDTTGQVNRDVTDPAQPPLIRDLVANGLLRPHNRGDGNLPGAAVDMRTYRALGSRNLYLANMLLWGPGFFTSSARVMSQVVQQILRGLYQV